MSGVTSDQLFVYGKLLDFFPIPVLLFSCDLLYLNGNASLARMFGIKEDEIRDVFLNSQYTDVTGVIPIPLKESLVSMICHGQFIPAKTVLISALEESSGPLVCSGHPLSNNGENLGGILFLYPRTDAPGGCFSFHQINNLVTGITGQLAVLKMLLKDKVVEKVQIEKHLSDVVENVEKLNQEIGRIKNIF